MASSITPSESFPNPDKFIWEEGDIEVLPKAEDQDKNRITDPAYPPLCEICEHNNDDFTCKAFPQGIPNEIYGKNRADHRKPIAGDGGVRFKKSLKKPSSFRARIMSQYSG